MPPRLNWASGPASEKATSISTRVAAPPPDSPPRPHLDRGEDRNVLGERSRAQGHEKPQDNRQNHKRHEANGNGEFDGAFDAGHGVFRGRIGQNKGDKD